MSGVITILGDPGGETCTCRYPTGFVDLKRLTALILERERAMDFVNIVLFQPDVAELLSRFVLFPNQDRLVR